jgi:hypothetical protein
MEFLQEYESSDEERETSNLEETFPDEKVVVPVKLALPSSIINMFPQEQHQDDPMLHQGRVGFFCGSYLIKIQGGV